MPELLIPSDGPGDPDRDQLAKRCGERLATPLDTSEGPVHTDRPLTEVSTST